MKKIYFIVSLAVLALFTGCQDYNATNFPGYDQAAIPTNVATYNYTLLDADYATISKAALAIATNHSDSTNATAIGSNKFFQNATPPGTFLPLLLNKKYIYADEKSVSMVTYNYSLPYDTLTILSANKYALVTADYAAMGTATNQPGKYNNFSSSIDPNLFIPIWLKVTKFPYSKAGDVKLIRYLYYVSSSNSYIVNQVYVYDGTSWAKFNTTSQVTKTFVYKGGKWLDILIYKGLTTGMTDFNAISVVGNQVWTWDPVYVNAKMSGYDATAKANVNNEDWLISPIIDLTTRSVATLTFNHTGKYFGTMSNEATLWVSENYTSGLPGTATWTQITIPTYMTNADYIFVGSGNISLNNYIGKKINLAFKYLSSPAAGGTWEIQNLTIVEE